MFCCEIYELFKNTYFEEHLWATACADGKFYMEKSDCCANLPLMFE